MSPPLMAVHDLSISAVASGSRVEIVQGIDFSLAAGEFAGLVGASGSGKTMTALALIGLLPPGIRVTSGSVEFRGENLVGSPQHRWNRLRGRRVSMVFQEPRSSLNPVLTIGYQIEEAIRATRDTAGSACRKEARGLLETVRMPDAARRLHSYPHELSGGERQRAAIAMALAGSPDLLIADEPTSALDVTLQLGILDLFERLHEEFDLAILLISHDLAIIAEVCDKVMVMQAGSLIEQGSVWEVLAADGPGMGAP